MKFLVDPLNERMKSTQALLDQLDGISERMKDQGQSHAATLNKRDELLRKVSEIGDRNDLINGYTAAGRDFDSMSGSLAKEVRDIQRQLD